MVKTILNPLENYQENSRIQDESDVLLALFSTIEIYVHLFEDRNNKFKK